MPATWTNPIIDAPGADNFDAFAVGDVGDLKLNAREA